jgi:phosphate uptake regulator
MGGGTLLISLPKQWVTKNGITKGSTVAVDELSDRKLVVQPIGDVPRKPKVIIVEYPKKELTFVINDVTGAYLLGYEVIRIQGRKAIGREDRSKMKSTIGRLIGLEIMDEDSKKITLQFLLEPTAVNPERIVRRMGNIIDGMLGDIAEGIAMKDSRVLSLVGERDDEVDRLYFLLVRTIRTATIDPEVAERYRLAPVEVLDLRVLASYLESVGDTVTELSKRLATEATSREVGRGFLACLHKLVQMQDLALQSFLSRATSRSRGIYLQVENLAKEISELSLVVAQYQDARTPRVIEMLGLMERISKLLVDISDLAVPNYQLV